VFIAILAFVVISFAITVENREEAWLRSTKEREDAWLQTFGPSAELVYRTDELGQETYHKTLAHFVKETSRDDEVLIMTHHKKKRIPTEKDEYERVRESYFGLLEQKVKTEGVKYHRLLCFHGPATSKAEAGYLRPSLVNHCRRMLELEKKYQDRVVLKKSTAIFEEDILLVRRNGKLHMAAMILDVHNPDQESVHGEGALIFHDPPDHKIIQQFFSLFRRTDKYGRVIKNISREGEIT
jgi:hypothetical protein